MKITGESTGDKRFNNEHEHRDLSAAEISVVRSLRTLLSLTVTGEQIEVCQDYWQLMSGFEYFIPEVLFELHPEWKYESFDGVVPLVAQKIGEREALFFGLSYLIGDQKLVPTFIQLQIDQTEERVNWLECRVGAKGPHGMQRWPHRAFDKQLCRLEDKQDQIDWVYWVTFGERR